MGVAGIDGNSRQTLTALSNANDGVIVALWADPVTHRLLIDNAASSSIAIGTTTIIGGTTTRILYDNAGVLGEYTITGTGTVVAMATSPSFTTPSLGVATVTSVNGLTITANGTNTLNIAAGQTLTVTTGGILGTAAYTAATAYATSTQGTTADNALPKAGGTMTGKIVSAGSSEVGATYAPASGTQTVALDCALNNIHVVSGNVNGTAITFTVANAVNNQCFIVSILQGSGTVSTISGWFSTVRWAGGIIPTLTATLNKRDTFGFIRTGSNTYDGFIIGQNC